MRFSTVGIALAGVAFANAALSPLHIKGSKFFDDSGNQFYIKGMPALSAYCFTQER